MSWRLVRKAVQIARTSAVHRDGPASAGYFKCEAVHTECPAFTPHQPTIPLRASDDSRRTSGSNNSAGVLP